MSNTRYKFTELVSALAVGTFEVGKTVTIEVIDAATDTPEILIKDTCTPFSDDPAVFYWSFSNLQTFPSTFKQFLYIMTDDSATPVKRRELVDTGGWAESIEGALAPADTCKITVNMFEADGSSFLEPNDLFDPNLKNYIQLKTKYFLNSRYFKLDKYKPSYDMQNSGLAYWIMPQGASVDIKIQSIGVDKPNVTIPNQSTITLEELVS